MDSALYDSKYLTAMAPVAAGQAANQGNIIDTAGFDAVEFVVSIGTIEATGTVTIKVQQDDLNAAGGMADLEGTSVAYTAADDGKLAILDVVKPGKRYVRLLVTTAAANGTINLAIARLYRAKNRPVTQSTSEVVASELHVSPAEGTA